MQKADKIWLDGKLVAWDDAKVHVLTHSLHYGVGVFEGIRAYQGSGGKSAIFRLREHMRRLYDSARIFMMEIPYPQEQLEEACLEVMRVNRLAEGYIRPIAFFGYGALGVGAINPVQVSIAAWPWSAYLGEEGLKNGIRAKVSSFSRLHPNVNMVRAKVTGQYVNSFLATREAALAGYQEAILLDTDGYVTEGAGENLFLVKDGTIYTPPLSSSVLAGITRDTILRLVRDLGIPTREERFTRDTLYLGDELFMTGTAAEVTPVREVDNRRIGAGTAGPITKKVQDAFFKAVKGEDPRYREWLVGY